MLFQSSQLFLTPIPVADPLAVEFVLDVRCDLEFSGVQEAVHLVAEVFCEFG